MPDLAATGVTVVRSWSEGGLYGKDRVGILAALTLSAMGSNTNKIPASAFGLQKIEECSNAVKSDNTAIVVACASADGSRVVLADLTQATDANRATPADLTGTFYITVHGYR